MSRPSCLCELRECPGRAARETSARSESGLDQTQRAYYDVDLSNAAISNMQIVVSPMFSAGNYLLLDALLEKYDYGIEPSDSKLKGKIKLK